MAVWVRRRGSLDNTKVKPRQGYDSDTCLCRIRHKHALRTYPNNDGRTDRRAIAPCQALVEHPVAPESERRQTVPQAA